MYMSSHENPRKKNNEREIAQQIVKMTVKSQYLKLCDSRTKTDKSMEQ